MKLEDAKKLSKEELRKLSRKELEELLDELISENDVEIDDTNIKI